MTRCAAQRPETQAGVQKNNVAQPDRPLLPHAGRALARLDDEGPCRVARTRLEEPHSRRWGSRCDSDAVPPL